MLNTPQTLTPHRQGRRDAHAPRTSLPTAHQFEAIFEHTPLPMLLLDSQGTIQRANKAATNMAGGDDLVGKCSGEALKCQNHILSPHGCSSGSSCKTCILRQTVLHTANTGESQRQVTATLSVMQHEKPSERELLLTTTPLPAGDQRLVLLCLEDVTERNVAIRRLAHQSHHDALTGLANRTLLQERLQEAIFRSRRENRIPYAVLFLDFDRFKNVNDSLGHHAGDQLLGEIAQRLKHTVEMAAAPDLDPTIARLGGDEFVILLQSPNAPQLACKLADRLQNILAKPYKIAGHDILSTASIGIVTSDCGHDEAGHVLRDADTAMYEAKAAGKGRAIAFDQSMRARAHRRLILESGLLPALERQELVAFYQPIVSLDTGGIEGFEALARWKHPQLGVIPPNEFIPIAEETGMILTLGEWIFREACSQLAQWRTQFGSHAVKTISVNLSRCQLIVPGLPQRFRQIALSSGVDPRDVHLEITENAIIAADKAAQMLHQFAKAGFLIDLDDFGTGQSSLASLHNFPIDFLKLDRSFTSNLNRGRGFAALVNAINTLAGNLNIQVIVEGVETGEQLALLQALNCKLAQGYYFARPMPPQGAEAYLHRSLEAKGIPLPKCRS